MYALYNNVADNKQLNYGAINWERLFVLVSNCTFICVGLTWRLSLLEFILSAYKLFNAKMLYVSPQSTALKNITFISNWVSVTFLLFTYRYSILEGRNTSCICLHFTIFITIFYALQPWQLWSNDEVTIVTPIYIY